MGFWESIWKTQAKDWTFEPLAPNQVPGGLEHQAIAPESAYVSVFLKSMRISHVRKGLSKFYGTVHSYISLPVLDGSTAEFQTVATPADLKNVDARDLDRMIVENRRVLGPVPYRGGDMEFELGLFSVRSGDFAGPFIDVLERLSSAAGVAFVTTARPFVGPLKDGINLLTGGDRETVLEIGVSTTKPQPETGYFFAMRAERGKVRGADLKLDSSFKLLGPGGKPVTEYPYFVFAVQAERTRADWFTVPDVAKAHNAVRDEVRKGNLLDVTEAFAVFKRTALTSPDLLIDDAKALVQKAGNDLESIMQATKTGAHRPALKELREIALYDA